MSAPDIDRLLHDAEHKVSGLRMAEMMRDHGAAVRFREERDTLLRAALAADPEMEDAAWDEVGLDVLNRARGVLSAERTK